MQLQGLPAAAVQQLVEDRADRGGITPVQNQSNPNGQMERIESTLLNIMRFIDALEQRQQAIQQELHAIKCSLQILHNERVD